MLLMLGLTLFQNQAKNYIPGFREISPKGGFTFGSIHRIQEDSKGFIWMGTHHGLFRYNTEIIEKFVHLPDNPNSIPSNYITAITKGADNQMWFASDNGIFYFNQQKAIFKHCTFNNSDSIPLPHNTSRLLANPLGGLWSINSNRLSLLDPNTETYQSVRPHPNDSMVNFMALDKENRLWLKSGKGIVYWSRAPYQEFYFFGHVTNAPILSMMYAQNKLWIAYESNGAECYDQEGDLLAKYGQTNHPGTNIKSNRVRKIIEDRHNNIWFGTYNGLSILHPNGTISSYDTKNTKGIKHSSIYDIYIDSKNGIWIGTWSGTLSYLNAYDNHFTHISTDHGLSNAVVSSINEGNGLIWIGTEGGGLNTYNPQDQSFARHALNPELEIEQNIKAIKFDGAGGLWIGTFNDGLWYINSFDAKGYPVHPKKILNGEIYDIQFDSAYAWIATYFSGLHQIPLNRFYDTNSIADSRVNDAIQITHLRTLLIDSKNALWIGTQNGIHYKMRSSNTFTPYLHEENNTDNRPAFHVYTVFEDHKRTIWTGTSMGLYRFNPDDEHFSAIPLDKTGALNEVYGITEDHQHHLWISTDNGIVQYNPDNQSSRLFTEEDGLQGNQFNPGAVFKASDGSLYFGGPNGVTMFAPENIKINTEAPQPIVVDLFINNQLQTPSHEASVVQESILTLQELHLKHHQNSLTFQFVANNFLSPQKNQFSYRLLNYNDDWNTGSFRSASYTKIPPGKYLFQLKAANNDGIWNETPLEISIRIGFPWWQTWYAYLTYISLAILLGLYIHRERKVKQQLLNEVLMEKIRSQHKTELNNSKLTFFTNISHEVKTPLSLIISPLEHLINKRKDDKDLSETLHIIQRNANRLKHLLHQLIDIRRIEAGQLTTNKDVHPIVPAITEVLEYFTLEAKERSITFEFTASKDPYEIAVDRDKLDKIIFNLLTNAFKYVNDHGTIRVKLSYTDGNPHPLIGSPSKGQMVEISVFNTDSYLSESAYSAIFERFFQLQSNRKQGTGIGLHMVKEYVLLHHGQIDIESDQKLGTTFIFRLPLADALDQNTTDSSSNSVIFSSPETEVGIPNPQPKGALHEKQYLILVVEDNSDLRLLLRKILSKDFSVITASNGKTALEQVNSIGPDLIISDVLMPEMNGFEFCQHIKTNIHTNHIPVILLTALNTEENQIEGYKTGADIYIAKPFSETLLITQIQNLLSTRKKLRDKFLNPASVLSVKDQQNPTLTFLTQAESIVAEHLLDPNFTVEVLADKLKISRASLHRKLKNQTDQSATEFIRFIRLKSAVKMLKAGTSSLSEVAYNVGFSSPSYFSISFKKLFGKTPKEYCDEINDKRNAP